MKTTLRCALSGVACSFAIFASLAAAGPLNPPAGAVAPTAKPLAEVEPRTAINATNTPGDATSLFKITQAGSYYLTGNITGVVGKNGIVIAASGVTLDLNGFDLAGVPGMGNFDGVTATSIGARGIAVVNGSVRNWGGDGIDLASASTIACRVEKVLACGNSGHGIVVYGGTTVANCSTGHNGGSGTRATRGCTVSDCTASNNGDLGIYAGYGCKVTNCSAVFSGGSGISTISGCTVEGCTVYNSTGNGIYADDAGCTVSRCTAVDNFGIGISVGVGSTVADCNAESNVLDGIACSAGCTIRGNSCSYNGVGTGNGAGVRANGSDNRIEGNNCIGADRGIHVVNAGNVIIRNTCSGNTTDWDIVANNVFGPIIDRRTPGSAAVVGFSAASTLGSTDPNANFSY